MGLLTLLEAARATVALKEHAGSGALRAAITDLEHAIEAAEASDPPGLPQRPQPDAWLGRYLTPEKIAEDLLTRMSRADVAVWGRMKKEDLIQVHRIMGRAIQNFYGLWHDENPYTHGDDPGGSRHPDQVSQRVIYLVWKHLTGKE